MIKPFDPTVDPIINMRFINTSGGLVLKVIRASRKSGYVSFDGITSTLENAVIIGSEDSEQSFPYTLPFELV